MASLIKAVFNMYKKKTGSRGLSSSPQTSDVTLGMWSKAQSLLSGSLSATIPTTMCSPLSLQESGKSSISYMRLDSTGEDISMGSANCSHTRVPESRRDRSVSFSKMENWLANPIHHLTDAHVWSSSYDRMNIHNHMNQTLLKKETMAEQEKSIPGWSYTPFSQLLGESAGAMAESVGGSVLPPKDNCKKERKQACQRHQNIPIIQTCKHPEEILSHGMTKLAVTSEKLMTNSSGSASKVIQDDLHVNTRIEVENAKCEKEDQNDRLRSKTDHNCSCDIAVSVESYALPCSRWNVEHAKADCNQNNITGHVKSVKERVQTPGPNKDKKTTLNVQVQFNSPVSTSACPSNRRRKSRPSAKKRRRIQQKRDAGPSTPLTSNSDINDPQKRQKTIHCNAQDSPSQRVNSNSPSPSINIKRHSSFRVTLLDISPHTSPDANPSTCHASAASPSPTFSKLSFVITDCDDSSDWGSEDEDDTDGAAPDSSQDDDLWQSFSNQGLCNPISFSMTCIASPCSSSDAAAAATSLNEHRTSEEAEAKDTSPVSTEILEANNRWNESYSSVSSENMQTKVHFPCSNSDLYQVRIVSSEHEAARKGEWEQFARDRERFQNRIKEAETVISPVLQLCHRQKVFESGSYS